MYDGNNSMSINSGWKEKNDERLSWEKKKNAVFILYKDEWKANLKCQRFISSQWFLLKENWRNSSK